MTPIEEFSDMMPALHRVADTICRNFPLPEHKSVRFDLFIAAACEESKVRQHHTTELVPFFQHFMNSFESTRK